MIKLNNNFNDEMEERRVKRESTHRPNDTRSAWDIDFARIIHSAAYRRLQGKTQVLGLGEADFYRTRLTHSMEVSQICLGILQKLQRNSDYEQYKNLFPQSTLITAIGMAHDIGHPPFGHGGEVALNYCMKEFGGFEGNAQTLRIISKLEKYQPEGYGINPTRRLMLGILKYPINYSKAVNNEAYEKDDNKTLVSWQFKAENQKPPKCYFDEDMEVVDFIMEPFSSNDKTQLTKFTSKKDKHHKALYKSFDTSIMDLADDISYCVHDLEDAITLGLISRDCWNRHFEREEENLKNSLKFLENWWNTSFIELTDKLFSNSYERKGVIGALVFTLIEHIHITEQNNFDHPLLRYSVKLNPLVEKFKDALLNLVRDNVIRNPNVQQLEFKGQKIIIELFETLYCDPKRLLPNSTKELWTKAETGAKKARVICDYIAGMTDHYAARQYDRLLIPNRGSIFEFL